MTREFCRKLAPEGWLPNLPGRQCIREPNHGGPCHYPVLQVSPDCRDGNCGKCYGEAWDLEADAPVECECPHHAPVASK
jgi:hypothetical protein